MFKKQNVLITGGAGKLGANLAKILISNGHNVLLGDINKSKLLKLQKKINSNSLKIFNTDLTKTKNIDKLIKYSLGKFKIIDAAIHCSYPRSKKWGAKFEKLEQNYLNQDLNNQLGATIIFSQKLMKQFIKQKFGNLILISSIQGLQSPKFNHYDNLKMSSPIEYSAIKAGIISITKYLSKYYRKKNIRVNCVSPGGIIENQPQIFKKRYKDSCNSKGLLNEEDISKTILFLLSKKSEYINGQNIVIDDGWSL